MEISELYMINTDQHEWLTKEKLNLESLFNIKIYYPNAVSTEVPVNDVIFITICGEKVNVENAKKLFQETSVSFDESKIVPLNVDKSKTVPLVTLSDSEDDEINPVDNKDDVQVISAESNNILKKARLDIQENLKPLPDFIPILLDKKRFHKEFLCKKANAHTCNYGRRTKQVKIQACKPTAQVSIPQNIVDPSMLRPIIIDASNVARSHGNQQKTFSCKGIQICVDYFLKRKHTCVKAFIPNNLRHWKNCYGVPITDQHLLEKMNETGHIVFTPSRNVNGKTITCYDDRFIVEYASATGGVIVSNDNFRDLMGEKEIFKKTIEERLLMYCFGEDIFMPAHDPLGRHGPTFEAFLSFPAAKPAASEENNTHSAKNNLPIKRKAASVEITGAPVNKTKEKKTSVVQKPEKKNCELLDESVQILLDENLQILLDESVQILE